MTSLTILIPAAGAARRMRGGDKLLELVGDTPILRRQAQLALTLPARVIVTLREDDAARQQVLQGLAVTVLPIYAAAEGMSASIRVAAANTDTALMILPADMPDLTAQDLHTLIVAFDQNPARIHRGAAADGTPGHPVIFPADLLPKLQELHGDTGARAVLRRHQDRVSLVRLPSDHATTDLDTPEQWAAWRARIIR